MCESAGESLAPHAPTLAIVLLPEAATGRLWDGKESLLIALGALSKACITSLSEDPGTERLVSALLTAAGRRKGSYRAAALKALEQLLTALGDAQKKAGGQPATGSDKVYAVVSPSLLDAISRHINAPASAGEGQKKDGQEGGEGAGGAGDATPIPPMPLAESLKCLAAAWRVATPEARQEGGAALFGALSGVMGRPGLPWVSWLAAVNAADDIITTSRDAAVAAGGGQGGLQVAWLAPLLRGLVHCLTHTTVSQVRPGLGLCGCGRGWGCLCGMQAGMLRHGHKGMRTAAVIRIGTAGKGVLPQGGKQEAGG